MSVKKINVNNKNCIILTYFNPQIENKSSASTLSQIRPQQRGLPPQYTRDKALSPKAGPAHHRVLQSSKSTVEQIQASNRTLNDEGLRGGRLRAD